MITAIVCLIIGACAGAVGMGILAGRRDADCETCEALREAQAECRAMQETIDVLKTELHNSNRKMYNIPMGSAGARILYDLWAPKNTPMKGD